MKTSHNEANTSKITKIALENFLDLTNLVPMWLCNYVIICIHEKETKNFLKFQTYSNMASTLEVVFLGR